MNQKRIRQKNCDSNSPSKRSRRSQSEINATTYYNLNSRRPTLPVPSEPKCKSCGCTGHLRSNNLKCINNPKYNRMTIIQDNMVNLFFETVNRCVQLLFNTQI